MTWTRRRFLFLYLHVQQFPTNPEMQKGARVTNRAAFVSLFGGADFAGFEGAGESIACDEALSRLREAAIRRGPNPS